MLSFAPHNDTQLMADLLCNVMVLCRGKNNSGKPCWAYICIKPRYAESFNNACMSGDVRLEEYGTILESGDGDEPPAEVKERMEKQFGMNHNFEAELLKAIKNNA